MNSKRIYPNAKDHILDTVEQIAMTEGILRITIDNVALKANISKGGVLYHFPNKEALIAELIKRFGQELTDAFQHAYLSLPAGRGRAGRALLSLAFDSVLAQNNRLGRTGLLFMSTFVHFPVLIESAREGRKALLEVLLSDGLPEDVARVVMLTLDGFVLADSMGLHDCGPDARSKVRAFLEQLIKEAVHEQ